MISAKNAPRYDLIHYHNNSVAVAWTFYYPFDREDKKRTNKNGHQQPTNEYITQFVRQKSHNEDDCAHELI